MIRKLKYLLLAAVALTAFGAVNATGAQAAEELFHCSAEPCRVTLGADGTGTTSHHVFVVTDGANSVSFTCKRLTADATTSLKTLGEVTGTGITYDECNAAGDPMVIRMNECDYLFTSKGGATAEGATIHVKCPGTKHIEVELPATGCILEMTPQTLVGAHFHNIGEEVKTTTEVTAELNIANIAVEVAPGIIQSQCPALNITKTLTAKYTTGNTLITTETDPASGSPVMANAWFA